MNNYLLQRLTSAIGYYRFFILFLALFAALFADVSARQVDVATAQQAGRNFLAAGRFAQSLTAAPPLQLVYTCASNSTNLPGSAQAPVYFYVFNNVSGGFVLVAGDNNVSPVLGYSYTGSFDPAKMPINVAKWLDGYQNEIRAAIENNMQPTSAVTEAWNNLLNDKAMQSAPASTSTFNPLVQTIWNQSP